MSDILNGNFGDIHGNGNQVGSLGGIHGNGNQVVNVGNKNTGPIINGPTQFFGAGSEVAKYQLSPLGRYPNLWELAMPGLIKVGVAVLVGLIQWLGHGSTLFNALGVPTVAMMGMGVVAIVIGMRGVYQLVAPLNLMGNGWTRHRSHYYERQGDGSIVEALVSAKCPVHGCAGTVSLKRPVHNEEGVEFAGICSDHGHLHAFEFNDISYEGGRLLLHPVREDRGAR